MPKTRFSIEVDVDAPPERVWQVMSDVERWPEWTPSVLSVQREDTGPLRVGSRARIRQPKLVRADWEVTALQPGREFTWITRSPGVVVTARHAVEPTGRGTRATLSIRYDGLLGPVVAWLTRGINDRYLGLEAAGLKRRSEA
jgi:uncharacterized protein YndB with AHSA1/START domain